MLAARRANVQLLILSSSGAQQGLCAVSSVCVVVAAAGCLGLRTAGGSGLPVIVEPTQVITILLGAVLLSFSATLYPAARAARVKPAEALRYE